MTTEHIHIYNKHPMTHGRQKQRAILRPKITVQLLLTQVFHQRALEKQNRRQSRCVSEYRACQHQNLHWSKPMDTTHETDRLQLFSESFAIHNLRNRKNKPGKWTRNVTHFNCCCGWLDGSFEWLTPAECRMLFGLPVVPELNMSNRGCENGDCSNPQWSPFNWASPVLSSVAQQALLLLLVTVGSFRLCCPKKSFNVQLIRQWTEKDEKDRIEM